MDSKDNQIYEKIYGCKLKSPKLEVMGQKGTFQGFW